MSIGAQRPNLFSFATRELSQDAFLCWLLSWADARRRDIDPDLSRVGERFLAALFKAHNKTAPGRSAVEVRRQFKNIDVLAIVGGKSVVIIEDKTDTSQRPGQLQGYEAVAAREWPEHEKVLVYLKTGDQASYAEIKRDGWAEFTRAQLLEVLRSGDDVDNAIFRDFVDHLEGIEAEVMAYRTLPAKQWETNRHWRGFLQAVRTQLEEGHWDYVSNPRGGFTGLWWGFRDVEGAKIYLQLEKEKLVVKLDTGSSSKEQRQRLRNLWSERVLQASGKPRFERPKRFGLGQWMTVAQLPEDYRLCGAGGIVDVARTVDGLRRAQEKVRAIVADGGG